ncbi:MAG: OmpA family protein, partial [Pseudomonadota bacterium]
RTCRVRVADDPHPGHTDAAGSDTYNQSLSELRAASVRDYLVQNYDVDPSRLLTEGRGEAQLLGGYSPDAGENRRVEFQAEG